MNDAILEPKHRGNVREIAAIDLGSNSFHIDCCAYCKRLNPSAFALKTKS